MIEAEAKQKAAKASREASAGEQPPQEREETPGDFDFGMPSAPLGGSSNESSEEASGKDGGGTGVKPPLQQLKDMGIELTDDDFQKILFKGFVEKEVVVFPSVRGKREMTATLKTLTGDEYDQADELLAEEISDVRATNEGYQTRRNMWVLSFGVTGLAGKPLGKVVSTKDAQGRDIVDLKETARLRRDTLGLLSPAILTKLMRLHGAMTVAINSAVEDPDANFLLKS